MSRQKGNVAEREVAALIKEWWRKLEPKADFVRTPLSGGWGATKEVRAGFKASGDLMTTATRFPFTVEVKRREGWTMERLTQGKKSPVWSWWRQAQTQADEMDLTPMLWLRKSREDWRIILPWGFGYEHKLHRTPHAHSWLDLELAPGVDYGERFPLMVLAEAFMVMPPSRFAL